MTRVAGIRHLILVRHFWSDELERVRTDERTGYTLSLDLRHVTGDA